jgi:hypothetical protein
MENLLGYTRQLRGLTTPSASGITEHRKHEHISMLQVGMKSANAVFKFQRAHLRGHCDRQIVLLAGNNSVNRLLIKNNRYPIGTLIITRELTHIQEIFAREMSLSRLCA